MSQNEDLDAKLSAFFEKLDKRMESIEVKLESRLSNVESQCTDLYRKSKKHENNHMKITNEISNLKSAIDVLEQDKLTNNILLKGVPEIEKGDETLKDMILCILRRLDESFKMYHAIDMRRIGNKTSNRSRLVLVRLSCVETKLRVMQNLSSKNLNCSVFSTDGVAWGSENEKIFVSDHLTKNMSTLFYKARQLKKKRLIMFAWTKLGKVYVKKNENSRAHLITNPLQLKNFEKTLADEEQLSGEEGSDDSVQEDGTESEAPSIKSTDSKRQRSRSPMKKSVPAKKSPRPKRHKGNKHE